MHRMHGRIQFLFHLVTCTDIQRYICMLFYVQFFHKIYVNTIINHELPSISFRIILQ